MFPYYTETRANQFVAQRNRNASYAAVLGYNNLKKFEKGIHSTNEFELQKLLLLPIYISSLSSASESYKGKIITKPGRLKEEEEEVKRNSDIERRACSLFSLVGKTAARVQHTTFHFLFYSLLLLCFNELSLSLSLFSLLPLMKHSPDRYNHAPPIRFERIFIMPPSLHVYIYPQ
jgi:hypothetical protein